MSRRELGYLLIGIGIGFLLSVVAVIELMVWLHHMFIMRVNLWPGYFLVLLPFALILLGIFLLRRKSTLNSN